MTTLYIITGLFALLLLIIIVLLIFGLIIIEGKWQINLEVKKINDDDDETEEPGESNNK